jgi:hypothetical protein
MQLTMRQMAPGRPLALWPLGCPYLLAMPPSKKIAREIGGRSVRHRAAIDLDAVPRSVRFPTDHSGLLCYIFTSPAAALPRRRWLRDQSRSRLRGAHHANHPLP